MFSTASLSTDYLEYNYRTKKPQSKSEKKNSKTITKMLDKKMVRTVRKKLTSNIKRKSSVFNF